MNFIIAQSILTPSQHWRQYSFQEVKELLAKLRNNYIDLKSPEHWCEVISPEARTRLYLDIDADQDLQNTTLLHDIGWEVASLVDEKLHQLFPTIFNTDAEISPISICTSNGKEKVSLHFVYNLEMSRADIKKFISVLNCSFVDSKPYTATQKWRMVYCTKPKEGINNADPEQRIKIPQIGSLEDSLVTYIPEGIPRLVMPNLSPRNVSIFIPDTICPRLKWFHAILNDPIFEPLWKEKAHFYDSWYPYGASLYLEGKKYKQLDVALDLFYLFSSYSDKFDRDECKRKFENDFKNFNNSLFPSIKSQVTRFNKEAAEKYLVIYKTGKSICEDTILPTLEEVEEREGDEGDTIDDVFNAYGTYSPMTSMQYRIYYHLLNDRIREYWNRIINNFTDLKPLYLLSLSGPSKKQLVEYEEVKNLLDEAYSLYGDVDYPFEKISAAEKKNNEDFVQFLCTLFEIPFHEDTMKIWQREEVKEETFDKAWKQYRDAIYEQCHDYWNELEVKIERKTIYRVKPKEDINYAARMNLLLEEAKEREWEYRIPYLSVFRMMRNGLNGANVDMGIYMSHFLPFLKTDTMFFYLARAYSPYAAAKIIVSFYPWWMRYQNELLVYDDMSGVWTSEENTITRIVARFQSLLQNSETLNFGECRIRRKQMIEEIDCCELPSGLVYENMQNSSKRKVLFPNGYMDGETGTFHPTFYIHGADKRVFMHPRIMFFYSLPDDYIQEDYPLIKQEIRDKLFSVMFEEGVVEYLLESLSTTLFRDLKREWDIHLGEPGCGKSTFLDFIRACVGDLSGTTTLDKLRYNKNESRDNVRYSFIYDNYRRNFLFMTEGANTLVDSELVKITVSAGLDQIAARTQYGKDKVCQVHFRMFVFLNSMFQYSSVQAAVINRTNIFNWLRTYAPTQEITDQTFQLPADISVTEWKTKPIYRQMMIKILLEEYAKFRQREFQFLPKPSPLGKNNPHSIGTVSLPKEFFQSLMNFIVFHGQPGKYITTEDLHRTFEAIETGSKDHGARKISSIINSLGLEKRTIYAGQKKISGRNVSVWYGMEYRNKTIATPDDDSALYLSDFNQWFSCMIDEKGVLNDKFIEELQFAEKLMKNRKRGREEEEGTIDDVILKRFHFA